MHLYVELLFWRPQHPPFGAQPALGRGRPGPRRGTPCSLRSLSLWGTSLCFQIALLFVGLVQRLSRVLRVGTARLRSRAQNISLKLPSFPGSLPPPPPLLGKSLAKWRPLEGYNSGLTGVSSFGFGGASTQHSLSIHPALTALTRHPHGITASSRQRMVTVPLYG